MNENQVQFTQPLQHDAAVGIIGGGISGLACAQVRHGSAAAVPECLCNASQNNLPLGV